MVIKLPNKKDLVLYIIVAFALLVSVYALSELNNVQAECQDKCNELIANSPCSYILNEPQVIYFGDESKINYSFG